MGLQTLKIVEEECAGVRRDYSGTLDASKVLNIVEQRIKQRIMGECVEVPEAMAPRLAPCGCSPDDDNPCTHNKKRKQLS